MRSSAVPSSVRKVWSKNLTPICRYSAVGAESSGSAQSHLLQRAFNPFVPKSPAELAKRLSKEIIFHKPGEVLVVNKPYGVSCLGYRQKDRGIFKKNLDGFEEEERTDDCVTLEDALPFLAQHFEENKLQFCFGLKRYTSGPVVLPCSERAAAKMKDSVTRAGALTTYSPEEFQIHRALTICIDKPPKSEDVVKGAAAYDNSSHSAKDFVFNRDVIVSRHDKRINKVVGGAVLYKVLASNHGMSLLEIRFSKFNRHLPRLILSHIGCPILGDDLYAQRLVRVGDELTSISPKDLWRSKEENQYIPDAFLKLAGKKDYMELKKQLPMFLAVFQTHLPYFGETKQQKNTGLIVRAPPPDHFLALSKLLGFEVGIRELLNSLEEDEIEHYEPMGVESKRSSD